MPLQNNAAKINFFFIIPLFLFLFIQGNAQDHDDAHDHDHSHASDVPHSEISAGMAVVYSGEYKSFNPAFHIHAVKGLTPFLGIGIDYELILTEELHHSISLMASYRPVHNIEFSFGPGIIIPTHDESWKLGIHAEASANWPFTKHLHAGPMIGFGWSSHGYHLSAGLHFGLDL